MLLYQAKETRASLRAPATNPNYQPRQITQIKTIVSQSSSIAVKIQSVMYHSQAKETPATRVPARHRYQSQKHTQPFCLRLVSYYCLTYHQAQNPTRPICPSLVSSSCITHYRAQDPHVRNPRASQTRRASRAQVGPWRSQSLHIQASRQFSP
jgi:hypothetical protein